MSPQRLPLAAALLLLALSACVPAQKKPASAAPAAKRSAPVDAAAQKRAYDAGVAAFGEEQYEEARKHWREALRLGAGTPVGRRSAENLAKVDAMLKSLRAIEKK